ncbi:hypothetical protein NG895_22165 [Aeoliella sp. ICT_H6.2]|uniref:MoxR-vWA-beta-propeller ternary system domain-containing protein n=1 Tax=Aeoliella straminimaris TaxID=2954799 RepID=A0A9X2FEC7_9BACT|nr:hypothetical protein [Aeoliella straminimaris]
MPTIELTIRPRSSDPPEAVAWYLPGGNTAEWLEEIARWPTAHAAIRLIAIRESSGAEIAGAVAIPGDKKFATSGKCVPLARVGENLYLPVDAELFPALPRDEVVELLAAEYVYVWLPGRGLTAAESVDMLRVADLMELPVGAGVDWSQAVPGIAFAHRLIAILPDALPSFDDVIDEGRDDIGERAGELKDLPKSPNEPLSNVTGAAMRSAMRAAAVPAMGVGWMLSALGNIASLGGIRPGPSLTGGSRSGSGGLSNFANELFNKISQSLEAQRNKEIGRLLHMLESDPDQGLKFAIPFGGGGQHRGLATPGGRLGMRNVEFSLGRLGGGGAADFWNMSPDYQQRLITKYRELAARETRLGRHRRAAYIYAELLGDLRSAASTLEQGRHFREAAVLYKDKLNNASAAAECLERGELWNEAIEAYRQLGRHEKVGDLLTHIEQYEEAAAAYHLAADELKSRQDLLGAARIYEEKLNDCRLALDTLDAGWPSASQAQRCTAASFALRGRLGWHDEAKQRTAELSADAELLGRYADIAEMLANVFEHYPESEVQGEAARLSRNLIANRLRHAGLAEADQLVTVLLRLDPSDRLLRRDGWRFVDKRSDASQPLQPVLARTKKNQLQLVRRFELGLDGVWRSAISLGEFIIAAGVMEGRVVFARLHGNGEVEKCLTAWPRMAVPSDTAVVMHGGQSPLRVYSIGEPALPEKQVFSITGSGTGAVTAGTPRGLDVVWGVAAGKTGHTWAIANRDDPALVCVDSEGAVISTQSLLAAVDAPWDLVSHPIPMHATGDHLVIAVGYKLLSVKNGQVEQLEVLPDRVIELVGGSPYAAPVLAACMESGVAVVRLGYDGYVRTVAQDLQKPTALLNSGGFLIAADKGTIQSHELGGLKTYRSDKQGYAEANHSTGKPIAILPAEQTNRFTLVSETGVISVYEAKS